MKIVKITIPEDTLKQIIKKGFCLVDVPKENDFTGTLDEYKLMGGDVDDFEYTGDKWETAKKASSKAFAELKKIEWELRNL